MVWNTAQSALYKGAVIKENNNYHDKNIEKNISAENYPKNRRNPPENNETDHAKNCPKNKPQNHTQNGNNFGKLFSDKDFIFLAVVMLILWRENADKKLILALAAALLA